jgi:hypothetical protein
MICSSLGLGRTHILDGPVFGGWVRMPRSRCAIHYFPSGRGFRPCIFAVELLGLIGSTKLLKPLAKAEQTTSASGPIPKRKLGKTGEQLSIVGFAGITVMDNSPSFAANIVSEAVDRGVNYFDVAPTYGNAQERLGPALQPHRDQVFLACKEEDWTKNGSAKLLDESLRLLRTDLSISISFTHFPRCRT